MFGVLATVAAFVGVLGVVLLGACVLAGVLDD